MDRSSSRYLAQISQAKAILSTQLSQLIATGINPYQAEAILHTYHGQLHSLALFNSAASLRRLAYPTYPAVYEQALKDIQPCSISRILHASPNNQSCPQNWYAIRLACVLWTDFLHLRSLNLNLNVHFPTISSRIFSL